MNQIFILSGQSNMAGRGGVTSHHHWDGIVPPNCQRHPSIIRLNAHLQWETAHEPLHVDIDTGKVCGVGPGMSFANSVRERVGLQGELGLVPCAVGGTAIKEWARGEHLYENMVRRAKEGMKKGEIKALLWYQGESDTSNDHDAEVYGHKMEELIHNVREDLNLPFLPFIQVAIASGDVKYMEKVREAQKGIKIENVVCVDAKGLELKEDNLHLTTDAQVQLGHILAEAHIAHFVAPFCTPSLALLVDVPRDKNITAEVMQSLNIPKGVRRVLFRTLNTDRRLMFQKAFDSSYIGFMKDGAQWLVDNTDIKLIGVDYLSVAAYDDLIPSHLVFLQGRDIILVEGLKLDDVPAGLYSVHCLPLRLVGAEGSPMRCILIK